MPDHWSRACALAARPGAREIDSFPSVNDHAGAAQFVFGYGSLAAEHAGAVARLRGHRRVWGVAMDNSRDLADYKHYRLRYDGSRPHVWVAFLDLEADTGGAVGGVVLPVDDALLHVLDRRERNYERVDLTEQVSGVGGVGGVGGTVWAYVGAPDGRARLRAARERGRAVISRDYLAAVTAGLAAPGPARAASLERSIELDGLEVWDLERVDHEDESPPLRLCPSQRD